MNDYLQDIRQFLLDNNYTNITIDGFVVNTPNSSSSNWAAIDIQGEPGISEQESPLTKVFFGIYVKANTTSETRKTAYSIRNLLNNKRGTLVATGSPVLFHHIICEQEPYFWSQSQNGQAVYLVRFSGVINNNDTNSIYY